MSSKLESFQARAKLCRDYAAAANSAANRDGWLHLADQWAEMAEAEAKRRSVGGRPASDVVQGDDDR